MSTEVVVTALSSPSDCEAVALLCGSSFPEEVYSQGLSVQQWCTIEAEDLRNTTSWWRQIGLARNCAGGPLLGVVVLTLEHEADDSISWSEYSHRVGCRPTILSWCYDRVLDEPLQEHECLVDFIAVSPQARGLGVGAKLMQWAEQTGDAILAETETSAVAAHGVDMTLWVAADNSVACRLYQRAGYEVVRRTDGGPCCNCMVSALLKWFLGHPVWIKMRKQLPPPPHLATDKPLQQGIALAAAAGQRASAALALPAAAAVDDVVVVLPVVAAPPLLSSLLAAEQALAQELPSQAGSQTLPTIPVPSSSAQHHHEQAGQLGAVSQQPAAPKAAMPGGELQAFEMRRLSTTEFAGQEDAAVAEDEEHVAMLHAAAAAKASQPSCPPSVHSDSIVSIATSDHNSGSDTDEDKAVAVPAAVHASSARSSAGVFELVSLQSDAAAAAAAELA